MNTTITTYEAQDDQVTERLTSTSMADALIEAERSWQSGSWDTHSEIDVGVH